MVFLFHLDFAKNLLALYKSRAVFLIVQYQGVNLENGVQIPATAKIFFKIFVFDKHISD